MCWYLTQICTNLGLTLEEVAEANLDKLFRGRHAALSAAMVTRDKVPRMTNY